MIRSLDFCSQKAAESEPLRPDLALISITAPGMYEARLERFPETLRVQFHDVEAGDEPYVWFEETHAKEVISFVERLHSHSDSFDVLVHCHAGISRSTAIALYVHALSDCAFPRRRFAGFANRTVLRELERHFGVPIPVPRALIQREHFTVRVLRDFPAGLSMVSVENREGEIECLEGPIADEGQIAGELIEKLGGLKDPPPAHQIQDWSFSL
jgi:broad specificity phosphatase PhoE